MGSVFLLANIFAFCSYIRSYCEPSARAERIVFFVFILWHAPKNEPRERAKGSAFGIRLCARKRRGAARPLCSCLREDRAGTYFFFCGVFCLPAPENFAKQNSPQSFDEILLFRFCVCLWKSKGKQIGQRFLLFRFARNLCWQGCVAGSKKICFRLLRATSVFAFRLLNANAKSEQ